MTSNDDFCVYSEQSNPHAFVKPAPECGMPAELQGPHGWLCRDHRLFDEGSRRPIKRPVPVRDVDREIAEGVIATDRRAIERGTVVRVRLGCIEPIVLHFLE